MLSLEHSLESKRLQQVVWRKLLNSNKRIGNDPTWLWDTFNQITGFSTYFALVAAFLSGTVGSEAFFFFFCPANKRIIIPSGQRAPAQRERDCGRRALIPQSRRATHPGRVKNKVGASSAWSARAGHAHSWPELVTLNGRHTSHGPLHPTPPPNLILVTTPPRQGSNRAHTNTDAHTRQQQHPPKCHLSCCPCVPFHRQHRQTDWGRSDTQNFTKWIQYSLYQIRF